MDILTLALAKKYTDEKTAESGVTKEYVDTQDSALQSQIDVIVSKSDVVDVVGTYDELQAYDTTDLLDNDIVKVLDDSTHNNARSYYRWSSETWVYVGSESIGYTKTEEDSLFEGKENKGKITIGGVEKTPSMHTVTISTDGVETTFTLVGVS